MKSSFYTTQLACTLDTTNTNCKVSDREPQNTTHNTQHTQLHFKYMNISVFALLLFAQNFPTSASFHIMNYHHHQKSTHPFGKMHSNTLQKSSSTGIFHNLDAMDDNNDQNLKRMYISCPAFTLDDAIYDDCTVASVASTDISVDFSIGSVGESHESRMQSHLLTEYGRPNQNTKSSLLTHLVRSDDILSAQLSDSSVFVHKPFYNSASDLRILFS